MQIDELLLIKKIQTVLLANIFSIETNFEHQFGIFTLNTSTLFKEKSLAIVTNGE